MLKVGLCCIAIGIPWDYLASNLLNIWKFNEDKILGIWILGLPVEEFVFCFLVGMAIASITLRLRRDARGDKDICCSREGEGAGL